jgi:hypothetical protein
MLESYLTIVGSVIGVFLAVVLTLGVFMGVLTGGLLFFMLPVVFFSPSGKKQKNASVKELMHT